MSGPLFDDFQEIPSDLVHPPAVASVAVLDHLFDPQGTGRPDPVAPLRNPHHETKVTTAQARRATPAAVLVPIIQRASGPQLIVTKRPAHISFAGHICFPGGRADPGDRDPVATALRESREEIGLQARDVRVLGSLGPYISQSGFRITPVIAVVEPNASITPSPAEVEAILELPLAKAFTSESYRLVRRGDAGERGLFILEHEDFVITGPTVSILIGLYEAVLGG